MATPTTLLVRKRLKISPHINRLVYSVPSVLPSSTSPRFELELMTPEGTLLQVKFVMSNNALVDIFFGAEDIAFRGTIAEVHNIRSVTQDCPSANNINAIFENTDTPPAGKNGVEKLYLEIDNRSSLEPTGAITLELMVHEGGIAR